MGRATFRNVQSLQDFAVFFCSNPFVAFIHTPFSESSKTLLLVYKSPWEASAPIAFRLFNGTYLWLATPIYGSGEDCFLLRKNIHVEKIYTCHRNDIRVFKRLFPRKCWTRFSSNCRFWAENDDDITGQSDCVCSSEILVYICFQPSVISGFLTFENQLHVELGSFVRVGKLEHNSLVRSKRGTNTNIENGKSINCHRHENISCYWFTPTSIFKSRQFDWTTLLGKRKGDSMKFFLG